MPSPSRPRPRTSGFKFRYDHKRKTLNWSVEGLLTVAIVAVAAVLIVYLSKH